MQRVGSRSGSSSSAGRSRSNGSRQRGVGDTTGPGEAVTVPKLWEAGFCRWKCCGKVAADRKSAPEAGRMQHECQQMR